MADEQPADVDGVDRLYQLEPGQFVAARDELARQLRTAGRRSDAAAVKGLRRPTVVAWALNQVARAHGAEVDELLSAGAAVREAQAAVVGGGDPDQLREAAARRRRIIARLTRAAVDVAGANSRDDAAATLDAASLDPDGSALLRSGRLTTALAPPSGFDLAAMPDPVDAPSPSPTHPARAQRKRLEDEAGRTAAAVATSEDRLARAEERLAAAAAEVESARGRLEAAVAEHHRASAALAEVVSSGP